MDGTVSFTKMSEGTAEDYALLEGYEQEELDEFPDRVLEWLRSMDEHTGYKITRLGHSLQAATRAHRAGEDEEMVVVALLHDIGDVLAPANHSEVAAALLRPYVSEENYWIVKYHGIFQEKYYAHHYGRDPDARDRYRDHPSMNAPSSSAPTTTRSPSTPTIPPSPSSSSSPWSAGSCQSRVTPPPERVRINRSEPQRLPLERLITWIDTEPCGLQNCQPQ